MQALLLALEFATQRLSIHADEVGATVSWLGQTERIILARQSFSHAAENAILALVGRMKPAAMFLDDKSATSARARRRAGSALRALAGSAVAGLPPRERSGSKGARSKPRR